MIIEQAKGALAIRGWIMVGEAFDCLRRYSRAQNVRLSELARTVITDEELSTRVLGYRARTG